MAYFDVEESFYFEQKLAQLKALDPALYGNWEVAQVQAAFAEAGLSAQEHFDQYGWAEELSANATFDVAKYLAAKAAQLNEAAYEGKTDWTSADVVAAFQAAGLSAEAHFTQYGEAEGLEAQPVEGAPSTLTEALAAYEAVKSDAEKAEKALKDALIAGDDATATNYGVSYDEATGTYAGFDAEEDYVTIAEGVLLAAKADLNAERQTTSDAELNQAVTDAQSAINKATGTYDADGVAYVVGTSTGAAYTAAQIQARADNAKAKLAANVAQKGTTDALVASLKDAVALYLNTEEDTPADDLDALADAIATYEGAITLAAGDATAILDAENDLYDAAATAYTAVFSGTDSASILAAGERGDAIEALLKTLNTRNDLQDDLTAKAGAFTAVETAVFTSGTTLTQAQADLAERQEYIDAVTKAEAAFTAISAAAEDLATANDAVEVAEKDLGYVVKTINTDSVLATDKADLFIFDLDAAEDAGLSSDIFVNSLASGDVLFLFGEYVQAEGKGDNNVFEFFLEEVDGNTVLKIENSAFGSNDGATGDFTTITLTGVALDALTVDGSVLTIA